MKSENTILDRLSFDDRRIAVKILSFFKGGLKSGRDGKGYNINEVYQALNYKSATKKKIEYLVLYFTSTQLLREKSNRHFTLYNRFH